MAPTSPPSLALLEGIFEQIGASIAWEVINRPTDGSNSWTQACQLVHVNVDHVRIGIVPSVLSINCPPYL